MKPLLAREHNLYLATVDDAMDLIGSGLRGCVFTLDDVAPNFFDLKNMIAGDVFQKFVNYNCAVAFVIPADHTLGERITELAREHASHPVVRICRTVADAERWYETRRE